MMKIYRLLGLMIMVTIVGCIKENSPKPAYIYVENLFFEADTAAGQGTSSSNITDFWVSVDGQQLGANNLPAMFPVILDENFPTNSIKISAGIKDNGITNTRTIYPFYEPYVINKTLEAGKIDTFRPTLGYAANAKIILVEDFETPTQAVFTEELDGNPNTKMINQSIEVFEGAYSGQIILDSANLDCTVATSARYYNLSSVASSSVYLELDYKTSSVFQVGLLAYYSSNNKEYLYKVGVNPTDTWKKIYINMSQEVYGAKANEYAVVFRALKNQNVTGVPKIYIDNVKILHF